MTAQQRSWVWQYIMQSLLHPLSLRQMLRVILRPRATYSVLKTAFTDVKLRAPKPSQIIENQRQALNALCRLTAATESRFKVQELAEFIGSAPVQSKSLGDLFERYGSDKSTIHNYHTLYAFLLENRRASICKLLEIGLGTNNIDTLSNMGAWGKPGASLRTFRDWLPNAHIYGADIDRRILFREPRIETYFVDQTNPQVLTDLAMMLSPKTFDVVIDDGLHNARANLNTLTFGLSLINDRGIVIIEDIQEDDAPYWQLAARILEPQYVCNFIRTKIACVFVTWHQAGSETASYERILPHVDESDNR
jgi:hypothetical protein